MHLKLLFHSRLEKYLAEIVEVKEIAKKTA